MADIYKDSSSGVKNLESCNGFTVMELIVVLLIIGILSSIAIPQYNDYLRRAKLSEGTATLADYRIKIEQYYQDNRNYGPVAGGNCGTAAPTSDYFTFVCTVGAAPGDTYVATATSKAGNGLGTAGAFVYTVNQQNTRATSMYKGVSSSKTCWLMSGAEC